MTRHPSHSHPVGLYYLFFTEMWERFSYYGMRSLLVYYMIKHLMFAQTQASKIYGYYTAFIYFTPVIGGWLADRYWGQKKTVIIGGVLMTIGHFLMAFESLFFPALLFLILGNGAFKPNISSQVGMLYAPGDPRRDRGYSIFYVGINIGAFLSPLICGTLGEIYGWHYGFGAAGVGMVVGLCIYLMGQKHLGANQMKNAQPKIKLKTSPQSTHEPLSDADKRKLLAFGVICVFNIIFRISYEQLGNTIALWASDFTNRNFWGMEIKASWFQSINPLLIFILTPLLTWFWGRQADRNHEPTSVAKMATGFILVGVSFLVMIPAAMISADSVKTSPLWLVGCMLLLTLGELYISPVGLSLVTKLSPVRMVSMLMGVWFLPLFAGNLLSGFVGTLWSVIPKESFFLLLAGTSIGAGLGMIAVLRPLKRAMGMGKAAEASGI